MNFETFPDLGYANYLPPKVLLLPCMSGQEVVVSLIELNALRCLGKYDREPMWKPSITVNFHVNAVFLESISVGE